MQDVILSLIRYLLGKTKSTYSSNNNNKQHKFNVKLYIDLVQDPIPVSIEWVAVLEDSVAKCCPNNADCSWRKTDVLVVLIQNI